MMVAGRGGEKRILLITEASLAARGCWPMAQWRTRIM
jgi:hypothetical protein